MFRKITDKLHITKKKAASDSERSKSSASSPSRSPITVSPIQEPKKPRKRDIIKKIPAKVKTKVKTKVLKKVKKSTSHGSISPQNNAQLAEGDVSDKWIARCLATSALLPTGRMNQVFAPMATLSALVAVFLATVPKERRQWDRVMKLDGEQIEALRERLSISFPISPSTQPPPSSELISTFRLITDDATTTRVNVQYMKQLKETLRQDIIVSCNSQKSQKYIKNISCGLVTGPETRVGYTRGHCVAALRARWSGRVSLHNPAPFATTYSERQSHPFFVLRTPAASVTMLGFEALSIPLVGKSSRAYSLIVLRPNHIGSLFERRSHISGDVIGSIVQALQEAEVSVCRLLLPKFSLWTSQDLCNWWADIGSLHRTAPSGLPLPPIDKLQHSAVFSMNEEGVNSTYAKKEHKQLHTSHLEDSSVEQLFARHASFAFRLDSPFIYLLVDQTNLLPIVAGSYAGSPAPSMLQIVIPCPKRILSKPPPRMLHRKPSKKEQRRARKEEMARLEREEERKNGQ